MADARALVALLLPHSAMPESVTVDTMLAVCDDKVRDSEHSSSQSVSQHQGPSTKVLFTKHLTLHNTRRPTARGALQKCARTVADNRVMCVWYTTFVVCLTRSLL